MPERGVSIGDPVNTAGHLATPEWQSFEMRMRHRRTERCVRRAAEAIDSGRFDEAGEALDEARGLEPLHPELQALSERFAALQAPRPAIVPDVADPGPRIPDPGVEDLDRVEDLDLLGLIDPFAVPESPAAPAESRSTLGATAVACIALALSALAGWMALTQWPTREPRSETHADINLPAEREPVSPLPETSTRDAALVPGISPEPVAPPSEEQPGSDTSAIPTPDAAGAPVNPEPPAIVPPAVESTTGTLPAPSAPPPAPRTIPRPVGEDAPRAPPQPAGEDPPRPLSPPAIEDPVRASLAPASAGVGTPPPPSVAAPVEPNRPAAVESARPSPPALDEHVAVRATLARYAAAYSDLDTAAAHAVWPGVDQRALARAFEGLVSQRVTLGACDVGVNGQTSRAICTGTATWTPKVGGGRQAKSRVWTFDLRRTDGGWQIARVDVR